MTDLIESAEALTTTIMAGSTSMMAVHSVFIITFRKTSEDITRSATAQIATSIIAIIITGRTNIRDTPGNPRERKIGGNDICDPEEGR
jgi:hypothetical protein